MCRFPMHSELDSPGAAEQRAGVQQVAGAGQMLCVRAHPAASDGQTARRSETFHPSVLQIAVCKRRRSAR